LCHQKIDSAKDGGRYPVSLVQQMKREHERRTELVTGIDPTRKSHVLLYGAKIGEYGAPLSFANAASAMFPNRYPASDDAISLGLENSAASERDQYFWLTEQDNLEKQFSRRVPVSSASSTSSSWKWSRLGLIRHRSIRRPSTIMGTADSAWMVRLSG
jgi:hypothetical protein